MGKHTNEASDTKQGRGQGELRAASVEGPYHIFSKQSRYLLRSNHSACLLTTGDISNAWRSASKQMTTLSATFFSRFLTMGCFTSPSVGLATENSYHCSALPRLHRGWQRPRQIAFFSYSFLLFVSNLAQTLCKRELSYIVSVKFILRGPWLCGQMHLVLIQLATRKQLIKPHRY